ncbi:MAG: NPCBM/NEW2 domain-containing protein [Planctomycetota bacterium]
MNRNRPYCPLLAACCLLPTACCLLLALPARAEPLKIVPVDGEPFRAELAGIDSQWQVTFRSGEERRVLAAADVVSWGCCAEVRRGPVLVLADGGLLVADVFTADKDRLTADSGLFGLVELPLELLAGVVFQLPADRHARDLLLSRVASATGDSDRAVLHNGDEVAGRVESIRDDRIRLETAVGPVDLEIHRTQTLVFNPALVQAPQRQGVHAVAGFRDGSRLVGDRLVVGEESLKIDLSGGHTWTAAPGDLVSLQPLGGRVTYLSDLKADGYRHVPFLDLEWTYQTDRNCSGGMLRSGGRLYLKGLGIHSAARLSYLLAKPCDRFQAELGIDDDTAGLGSVRFRVFVDGEEKHTSDTIRGGTPPVPVSVDLAGAKRLDLIVDFADRAGEQDHANWLDARLVGPAPPAVSDAGP